MAETTTGLRYDIEDTRSEMSDTLEAIGDRVSPSRIVERRRNRVANWYRDARDRVMGTAEDMTDRLGDTAARINDGPSSMASQIKQRSQGSPVVAGAIAFGVGVLMGGILPESRTERRLGQQAMQAAEPIKGELQNAGREVAQNMQQPVRDAVEEVKQTAAEGASSVKETAQEGTQQVRQQAQA
jgi:ElaB/YqjD/DUF883 family membrane-anchored ribosome-binding protein